MLPPAAGPQRAAEEIRRLLWLRRVHRLCDRETGTTPDAGTATASAAPEQADGLYLFTTVTCPNCKIAKNELEKAGLHYTTMDVSEHMDLVTEYGIQQAPTLIVPPLHPAAFGKGGRNF